MVMLAPVDRQISIGIRPIDSTLVDYSVLYIDHENFVGTVPYNFLQMMKRRGKKTVPTKNFHDDLGWLQSFCKLR